MSSPVPQIVLFVVSTLVAFCALHYLRPNSITRVQAGVRVMDHKKHMVASVLVGLVVLLVDDVLGGQMSEAVSSVAPVAGRRSYSKMRFGMMTV